MDSMRKRSLKRVAIRATFLDIKPAHANFFAASATAASSSTAMAKAIREIFGRVREAKKARKIKGRISTIKMTVSISKAEG